MSTLSPIEARIQALRDIQDQIQELRRKVESYDPVYRPDVLAELRAVVDSLISEPDEGKSPILDTNGEAEGETSDVPTTVERMRAFFGSRRNAPASLSEIVEGTGAGTESIRSVLYKRNRGRFRKVPSRSSNDPVRWQIEEVAEEQTHGPSFGADEGQ